jgi:hypothetical protein
VRVAAGVLLDRDQRRHSAPFAIDSPHQMARALRRNHHHVNVGGWNDRLEVNAESVRDPEHFAGMQIRFDGLFVEVALRLVGCEHVDPVGALAGLIRRYHDHAVSPSLGGARPVRVEPDDDFESAVAKILRLGVSLAAIPQNGDRLALQYFGLRVAFIENFDHQRAPLDPRNCDAQGRKKPLRYRG